jgi:ubiquitin-protein ligase
MRTALIICRETNLMRWKCHVPGKEGTPWEGGFFPITMEFSEDYPAKPPKVSWMDDTRSIKSHARNQCYIPLKVDAIDKLSLFLFAVQISSKFLSPQRKFLALPSSTGRKCIAMSCEDFVNSQLSFRLSLPTLAVQIYPSGTVCLSILNEDEQWRPSITVKQILLGIQELLNNPNEKSPAQSDAYVAYTQRPDEYKRKVREQVAKYRPPV